MAPAPPAAARPPHVRLALCSQVEVWSETTDSNGKEIQPQWSDCTAALNLLRSACGNIANWGCDLMWGTCPKCGYGSCIHATFLVAAACPSSITFGVGASGPTIGAGVTKIGWVCLLHLTC